MSVKHVEAYYEEVCKTYTDMKTTLKCMEEEAAKGLVLPEALEQMKKMISPLMDNYQKLSYIMFLLHKPTKKEKEKGYEKRNAKLLAKCDGKDKDYVLNQNKQVINDLSNLKIQ